MPQFNIVLQFKFFRSHIQKFSERNSGFYYYSIIFLHKIFLNNYKIQHTAWELVLVETK